MIMDVEEIARISVDCGYHLHRELGPGLLESVYEAVLFRSLERRGLLVERQKPISFIFDGMKFDDAFKIDLMINQTLLVEIKSVEKPNPVYGKQVLTYLRLTNLPLGLLMNFGMASFKEGIQRIVNNHSNFASSRLRVNNIPPKDDDAGQ
jgi:GxxExxY protein